MPAPAAFAAWLALCAALALGVLSPALRGPFVSDDLHYVPNNPYVTGFSLSRLGEVLDPRGEPVAITENYTPVHLLFHAAAWRAFGPDVTGHHVLNVLLHALAAALLAPLLRRSGLPLAAALGGSLFFLLHPANVEAAAWINQVKSTASVGFALLALLALERRPALATLCFVLALLAKPTSAFVLPVAVVFSWTRLRGPEARRAFVWLGVWSALFAAYAVVEMLAFTKAVSGVAPIHPDPFVRLRTSVGFVARYLAMAASSLGVSAFHEPPPALSPLDPWWLAGLAVLGSLGARTLQALRARREEAAYWIWAASAFLPVAQLFPFPFPLADRYLYPILPGLIGGFLLAAQDLTARLGAPGAPPRAGRAGARPRRALALRRALARARAHLGRARAARRGLGGPLPGRRQRQPAARLAGSAGRRPRRRAVRAACRCGARLRALRPAPRQSDLRSAPGRPGLRRADRRHGGALDHTARCAPRSGAVGAAFPRDRTPSARRARGGAPRSPTRPRPGRSAARGARAGAPALRGGRLSLDRRQGAALAGAFLVASLWVYAPALPGPFMSDDLSYVALNPYVRGGTFADVLVILDPTGDAALTVANWAPVHLLAHALEWRLFGWDVRAYHLTNVLLHVLASLLLVALLLRVQLPAEAAALGGAFFLLHPANVEAVGWISQLKSVLALVLLLGALLLRTRRPLLATLAFVLALLSKALAAIALPVAFALDRARAAESGAPPPRAASRALWLWAAAFAAFASVELPAFLYFHPGGAAVPMALPVRLASAVAIGARYLVMATTGYGVSSFHGTPPVHSLVDPWFLGGVAAGLLLAARCLATLRSRKAEGAFWLFAAGSYLPVSQLAPFLYPMGDRYLYFILPGLIGAALLAGREALARLAPALRLQVGRGAAVAAAAVCVFFAVESHGRAALWASDALLMADSVRNYPDSELAHYVRAGAAARDHDVERVVAELREAARSPVFSYSHVQSDPHFAPMRGRPEFRALLLELAQAQIDRDAGRERLNVADLLSLAEAQLAVGDAAGAVATVERAPALPPGYRERAAALLEAARSAAASP